MMASSNQPDHLFNPDKLEKLSNWTSICDRLKESGQLIARPLRRDDFANGYLELLRELTQVGDVTQAQFEARFTEMKGINRVDEHYLIVVIEDTSTGKIVGASTLFVELKFIHNCARRARLEDVAVLKSYRGRNIGEIVVSIIVKLADEIYDCYKISLDCSDDLKKFYAKNNFKYGCNMLYIKKATI